MRLRHSGGHSNRWALPVLPARLGASGGHRVLPSQEGSATAARARLQLLPVHCRDNSGSPGSTILAGAARSGLLIGRAGPVSLQPGWELRPWELRRVLMAAGEHAQDLEEREEPQGEAISFNAAICCLRGRAFEALENLPRACACFTAALRCDPFCYEAFQVPGGWTSSDRPRE